MIWAILSITATLVPILSALALVAHTKAQQRPIRVVREDCGFGGEWK